MSKIVQLRRWYYPTIIRVVMDRSFCYHVCVIESEKQRYGFREDELRLVLGIKETNDWLNFKIRHWDDARKELLRCLCEFSGIRFEHELFVTLRPRHKEMFTLDDTLRQQKARA